MDKNVQVFNDGELVFEGQLKEFLDINLEDKEFILSHINFEQETSEFHETSGEWKIKFI